MNCFYNMRALVLLTLIDMYQIVLHANALPVITKSPVTQKLQNAEDPLLQSQKPATGKRYYEIVETRYAIPLPYCGKNCLPKWKPSDEETNTPAASSDDRINPIRSKDYSQVAALTADAPEPEPAAPGLLPHDHKRPPVKVNKEAVALLVPEGGPTPLPAPPEGISVCDKEGKSNAGLQSPIALGRPSKLNAKKLGPNASKDLPEKKQRVSVNKYYGRLRDRFYMENDGYNLNFYLNENKQTSEMTMKVKEWDDEYVFGKAVLHWGNNDSFGSEHTIHGQRFPLEIQFIHYKRSLGSMENAQQKKYGVMIASVLYDFSGFEKNYLEPIIRQAASLSQPGRIKQVHGPLEMKQLFPGTLEHYEYSGSYSTAPCSKEVRRIVFHHPGQVGRDQLHILRKVVRKSDGKTMADNYRKLHDASGREIIFNPTLGQFDVENRDSLMQPQEEQHW